jgi:phycoerythrobilin:ferredoxin oxidoreductase
MSALMIRTAFTHTRTVIPLKSSKKYKMTDIKMCSSRGTAPGSKFESWYQTTMERLSSKDDPLIPLEMDPIFASNVGTIGKSNVVFESKAWQSKSLRYVRLISFVGEGYDVFNFLAIPRSGVALPILGIDVVSLPRGSLAAIDFQPQTADQLVFNSDLYSPLKEVQNKFLSLLPSGGDFPEEAKRYFSPLSIWTRIPGSSSSSSSSSSSDSSVDSGSVSNDPIQLMSIVGDALDSYVQEYATLLSKQNKRIELLELFSDTNIVDYKIDELFLSEYLAYRTSKDPAKRLLVGAFGAEWTENVLETVMFPTHTQDVIDSQEDIAVNVPETITFVTGNAKKRMEVYI